MSEPANSDPVSTAPLPATFSDGIAETPLDHARRLLKPFLDRNPHSTIDEITGPQSQIAIIAPWGDTSLLLMIPENVEPFADAINNLYLPRRFTALWHSDTKELEVMWTAFKLAGPSADVDKRKFTYVFNGVERTCEFGRSSDRLLTLAKGMRPTGPSTTQYRNLQSFNMYGVMTATQRAAPGMPVGEPISFWIRGISEWNGDHVVEFAKQLNFYLTFYDYASPIVLVHEPKPEGEASPRTRYVAGKFPERIRAQELDDSLLHFWEASRTGDPARRFVYCYRIIEYASTLYLEGAARAAVRKALSSPHALDDMDALTDKVVAAIQRSKLEDFQRCEAVVKETVDPELLWNEMQQNIDAFRKEVTFDGGFVLSSLIGPNTKKEDFLAQGLASFHRHCRDIRNALSHGRDQKTAAVITPTARNFSKLEPWGHLISVAAGEVILYENVLLK